MKNLDVGWFKAQERYIKERDKLANVTIKDNRFCKNCGVEMLKVHIGMKWCGDCRTIPLKERNGYYAQSR